MLRTENLSDEELSKKVNELASNQAERQTKIGMDRVKVNSVSPSDGSELKGNKTTPKEEEPRNERLLAEIKEIKSEISDLRQQVNFGGQGNHRENPFSPRGSGR